MIFEGKDFSFELGKKTYVMGILNVTEDSFADGGKYNTPDKAKEHTKEMLENGADIIDIGAQSTKPGKILMSAEEELNVLKQYLPLLSNEFDLSLLPVSFPPFFDVVPSDDLHEFINSNLSFAVYGTFFALVLCTLLLVSLHAL